MTMNPRLAARLYAGAVDAMPTTTLETRPSAPPFSPLPAMLWPMGSPGVGGITAMGHPTALRSGSGRGQDDRAQVCPIRVSRGGARSGARRETVRTPPHGVGGSVRIASHARTPAQYEQVDIVCVVGILALAAIVALVGRGVEKL